MKRFALVIGDAAKPKTRFRVLLYKGEPFDKTTHATLHRACRKAGIEDFTWQDFRHTWASWQVQHGTSLQELMEMGGWKNYSMVVR